MAPNRSYESLVAGMRERPTIFDAEDVLKKDYKVRFPDRRDHTLEHPGALPVSRHPGGPR